TRWAAACVALVCCAAGTAVRSADKSVDDKAFKPLFDGKDLSGWHLRHADGKNGWTIQDGILMNQPPSTDLVSDKEYLNFEIRYDYRQYGNSGVGLRGRYEIQIDDSAGKPAEEHGDGAIYSQLAPAQNVGKPKGQWESIDATL